jgi:phosphatidate cytidylyltransferase
MNHSNTEHRNRILIALPLVGLLAMGLRFPTLLTTMVAAVILIHWFEVGYTNVKSPVVFGSLGTLLSIVVASYCSLGLVGLVELRASPGGLALVTLAIVSAIATDTVAYEFGKRWGKPGTFFPKVSPNKSWQGALAGWAAGVLVVLTLGPWAARTSPRASAWQVAIMLPAAAIAGDLLASWAKRQLAVKDWSRILREHGGLTDRIDSVGLVLLVVWYVL